MPTAAPHDLVMILVRSGKKWTASKRVAPFWVLGAGCDSQEEALQSAHDSFANKYPKIAAKLELEREPEPEINGYSELLV